MDDIAAAEGNKAERSAERARRALAAIGVNTPDIPDLGDLIADLMHLADEIGPEPFDLSDHEEVVADEDEGPFRMGYSVMADGEKHYTAEVPTIQQLQAARG